MPTSSAGPPTVREGVREPLVEAVAALGQHLEAVRRARRRARRPGRRRGGRPASRRTASRVSAQRRLGEHARPPPACTAGTGGSSTRPATGALAMTTSAACSRSSRRGVIGAPRAHVADRPRRSRAPCRSPSTGRPRGPVGDVHLGDRASPRRAPAAPSPAASRSGGRQVRGRAAPSRRRGPHRAEVAQPQARCGGAARRASDGVGEPGVQRPGAARRAARAEHQVGLAARARGRRRAAGRPGPASRRASMKHTTSAAAAASPAKQAAPNPRRGSCDHRAPRRAGDVGRAVRGAVVDHDRAIAGRHAARAPTGSAAASSRHGEDDVGHSADASRSDAGRPLQAC